MIFDTVVTQNVSEQIAQELRVAIQSGKLKPGERLVERTLASSLGVSHIPIREALGRLADEGLVERTPRRGARVAALSEHGLREISSLRIVLEQFVALRAQAAWNEQSEKLLRDIATSMVDSSRGGDVDTMFALDQKFHETLWQLADHQLLMSMVAQLRGRINAFLRAANDALSPSELAAHAASHFDVVDAIASGDRDRANLEIARHIETAAERIRVHTPHISDD
jgi:DNA-binding GntR family transcriptional regulator